MSHELRTPLNAILGYTELILDDIYGELPSKMRQVLERVQSQRPPSSRLHQRRARLVQDRGRAADACRSRTIPRKMSCTACLSAVEPLAAEKGLALKADIPARLPIAHGDERRIAQVLLNLVGNAIKFTDAGEVAITASAVNGSLRWPCGTPGPGIAAADQARIFDEFQQADSSMTRNKGGTGLGLAIAKRIVEMHGGQIWVESTLGQGSTLLLHPSCQGRTAGRRA